MAAIGKFVLMVIVNMFSYFIAVSTSLSDGGVFIWIIIVGLITGIWCYRSICKQYGLSTSPEELLKGVYYGEDPVRDTAMDLDYTKPEKIHQFTQYSKYQG